MELSFFVPREYSTYFILRIPFFLDYLIVRLPRIFFQDFMWPSYIFGGFLDSFIMLHFIILKYINGITLFAFLKIRVSCHECKISLKSFIIENFEHQYFKHALCTLKGQVPQNRIILLDKMNAHRTGLLLDYKGESLTYIMNSESTFKIHYRILVRKKVSIRAYV